MPVGINFGSATSGDGFDVASTVSSIMAIQRTPETNWKDQLATLQTQDTALTKLGSDLSSLSSALASLTAFDGKFSSKVGASSDTTVVALTGAGSSARAGTHTLSVERLAQTSSKYSVAIAATDALGGTLSIQIGSKAPVTITLNSQNNTIAGLASSINQAGLGVSATVITDKSGSHISLVSGQSGSDGEITLGGAVTDQTTGASVSFFQAQSGVDAAYTLDGISLTSSTNSVSTALPGISFQLLQTTDKPIQIQIANDTSSTADAVSNFVSTYNTLVTDIAAQEGKDSSGNAQPLYGDRTLSLIQSQVSAAITDVSGSGSSIKSLSDLGVTVGVDGKLTLDSQTLSSALNNQFDAVTGFFLNANNFGQKMTITLNGLGSDSKNGSISLALAQNSSEETTLNTNVTNLENRLSTYETTLTAQLNAANQILQAIPSKLNEMKQIYAAITGYSGN